MIVGDCFLEKFTITQEVYESFKKTFMDFNALHTDDSYARSKGFEEKVMHGNILCGFLSCFIGELLPKSNTIIHSLKISYKKPCYLNDVVTLDATLFEVYESVKVYVFKFKFLVEYETKAIGEIQIGLLA